MKIFILSYYGYKNTGDDAIVKGLGTELYNHGEIFRTHHNSKSKLTIVKEILKSGTIVIPGGTHLRNWGKGWLYQSLRMLLFGCFVRLLGKKFIMCNVGIDGKAWEWLARRITNKITIRDRDTFDSAALMNYDLSNVERKKIIGINLTPVNKIYYNDKLKDNMIAGAVSVAVKLWLDAHPDWSAKCISFNGHKKYEDDTLNKALSVLLGAQFVSWQQNPITTLKEVAECSVMIGMRYHACVFAALAGLPLLSIESYPSIRQFMNNWYWHPPLKQEHVIDTVDFLDHFAAFMEVAMMPGQRKYKPQLELSQMKHMAAQGMKLCNI